VAARLAGSSASQVWVVHLVERLFLGRAGWCSVETEDEARRLVNRFRSELEALGVRAAAMTGRSRRDQIARDIVRAASECSAEVIVIGTHRTPALLALLTGSVTKQVIRMSRLPVVVVP